MRFFGKTAFICAFLLAAFPLFAADGILIVIVEKPTSGAKTHTNQIQVEKERMRAEMVGANGENQAVVFDSAKQVLSMINFDRKTYTEIRKADVDRRASQMSDAMAKLQAQMASLPPAQRAQMEGMMRGRLAGAFGGAPAPKTEYRQTGTDKVGKWTCDKYEGFLNNQKVSELCTVDPKALGFALSDFEITKQLADFFQSAIPMARDRIFAIGTRETQGYDGFPVRRVSYLNGQPQSTSELTDVTHQSFAASTYDTPPGFQKEAFGGGRGPQ